ncbi:5-formyltetrahydrofolate cyclo-ligase [Martensiomyces pterosporus]|nr:5-formyltetrahydrofolate cyclo-ligase [Martensiomyces pterosporus]
MNATSTTVRSAKQQLRKRMQQTLASIPSAALDSASTKVLQQITSLPKYRASKHISIYISMDQGELQTTELLHHALCEGKAVYVPRCNGRIMDMIRVDGRADLDSLPKNKWGIPEPDSSRPAVDPQCLDFIVVPGVAFDTKGNRCGHGKGYYDRYLSRSEGAYTCAVCLDEQVVDEVPTDEFDRTPDVVLAPQGTVFEKK